MANRCEPSAVKAAEVHVLASTISGDPTAMRVSTSQSTTVPSSLAEASVRPSREKSSVSIRFA
jgi:hypothetical protein